MSYPIYERYRPSRIEWAPSIPADWDECAVKINYSRQLGKMLQNEASTLFDVEISYLKALHVNWNRVTTEALPKMWASPSELESYAVQNGDLLVCEGGEVGRAAILEGLDEPAIIQNAVHRIRNTSRGDVRYFSYLLRNIADAGWFAILCNKATIAHLTVEKLGSIQMPVPPLFEQTQITKFLDWKTGQIDALIAKKKELMEKLKEKRLAVITQAVTKGLNFAAPMRNSGIPWLGEIPLHWDVTSLRWFLKTGSGDFLSNEDMERDQDNLHTVPVIGGNGVMAYTSNPNTKTHCLIVGRVGAHCGNVHLIREKCWVTDNALRIAVIDETFDSGFLYWLLKAMNLNDDANRNAQPLITGETIKSKKVVLPPIAEQVLIADYITQQFALIATMQSKVESALVRLTEYRTAVITAATTGKIDVRQVAIPAPT